MRHPRRTARVTVGLGALVLSMAACRSNTALPSERAALAKAVASNLPFQSRISGGFEPSTKGSTRAAGDRAPELSPDTRIAIALIEKRAIESPTPDLLADLGVAYLVQGDVDRAITTLDDAASQLKTAAPWSDLSAAYLAKAERTPARKIELLSRALDAAEKSLKASRTNDALFNRALARDGLARYVGVGGSWAEFAAAESDPRWKEAAAHHASPPSQTENLRDRWEARRKSFAERLKAGDTAFVNETVRLFPEASIEFLERELMVDASALKHASMLASAILAVTHDPMARDAVAALQSSPAALTQAHAAYARGVEQFEANDRTAAARSFAEATVRFSRIGSPYQSWVQTRIAAIDWREGRLDDAQRALAAVEATARRRHYSTLLATVLWHRGITHQRQWALTDALDSLRESASQYEAANEREYAVRAYSSLADALRMLGESNESWSFIGRTLEELPNLRTPIRRYLLLYDAALFAGRLDLQEAALLFQDAAVREAENAGPDVLTEASIQRALVKIRRGDIPGARGDLDRAAPLVATTSSPDFKAFAAAELAVALAQLGDSRDSAATNLESAIGFFSRRDPGRLPALYLLLARTPQAKADRRTAEDALRRGINTLEAQQAKLGDEALRISYFDESWGLFHEMVGLQVAAKNSAAAFEYAERSRARALLASMQVGTQSGPRSLPEIQASLPDASQLVLYSVLADRLLIWTVSRSNSSFIEQPMADRELARLVDAHRMAIINGRENRDANDRLYAAVVGPIAAVVKQTPLLVLVPDGPLHQMAFAALREPSTGRYLIEDHALLVTPSASFFASVHPQSRVGASREMSSALLIGNPAASGAKALPGAEREARTAATLYKSHELLVGRDATKERFLKAAPSADVIHFGGHALVNPEFPLLSRLIFADEDQHEQVLFAHEIARLHFPRTRVIVLAACSTASGAISRGEGVVSVARPFLASGVPTVIASQWDVDDSATEQLTLNFHRALARLRDPIEALHVAQLAMLRSGNAAWALPQSWGAFVAIGTGAQ